VVIKPRSYAPTVRYLTLFSDSEDRSAIWTAESRDEALAQFTHSLLETDLPLFLIDLGASDPDHACFQSSAAPADQPRPRSRRRSPASASDRSTDTSLLRRVTGGRRGWQQRRGWHKFTDPCWLRWLPMALLTPAGFAGFRWLY
jgi:hypothetical protein